MKRMASAVLSLSCVFACFSANACPDGELQFSFSSLEIGAAFALFADFAGLKPEIDRSLTQSEPMSFGCTPWRVAATKLADRHNLSLRIENGIMYVSRK